MYSSAGTPGWQAPELFNKGRGHGLAVDIWSMGIMTVQLLIGSCHSRLMNQIEEALPSKPDIKTLDFKGIFDEIYEIRHDCASDGSPREDFIRRCLECDPKKRMTVNEALKHPYINEPAGVRQRFEKSAQETAAGWTSRAAEAEVRELPDVLRPPPTTSNGIKEKIQPKISGVGKKGTLSRDIENLKSPYFRVTKLPETKRARSEELKEEESREKRMKLVKD